MRLTDHGKPSADRSLDPHQAVVVFEPLGEKPPATAASAPPPKPIEVQMLTVRKEFEPRVVIVPVGSIVRFPNQDPILHNVFSVSGRNAFDLGLVGSGRGKTAIFREAGLVRVYCNVHHAMYGFVFVAAGPYYAQPDKNGDFRLAHLPDGPGRITFWHERGDVAVREVTLPLKGPLTLEVEITQPRVPAHKNKFGKSYSAGGNYG